MTTHVLSLRHVTTHMFTQSYSSYACQNTMWHHMDTPSASVAQRRAVTPHCGCGTTCCRVHHLTSSLSPHVYPTTTLSPQDSPGASTSPTPAAAAHLPRRCTARVARWPRIGTARVGARSIRARERWQCGEGVLAPTSHAPPRTHLACAAAAHLACAFGTLCLTEVEMSSRLAARGGTWACACVCVGVVPSRAHASWPSPSGDGARALLSARRRQ